MYVINNDASFNSVNLVRFWFRNVINHSFPILDYDTSSDLPLEFFNDIV